MKDGRGRPTIAWHARESDIHVHDKLLASALVDNLERCLDMVRGISKDPSPMETRVQLKDADVCDGSR